MAEQERSQRPPERRDDQLEPEESEAAGPGEEIADRIDDLLEEIDTVLEENAEEFVKNYVQKGGE